VLSFIRRETTSSMPYLPKDPGKTSLVEAACSRAGELGHEVVHARGSELESGFAFGVVRQLFERRLAAAGRASVRRC